MKIVVLIKKLINKENLKYFDVFLVGIYLCKYFFFKLIVEDLEGEVSF